MRMVFNHVRFGDAESYQSMLYCPSPSIERVYYLFVHG